MREHFASPSFLSLSFACSAARHAQRKLASRHVTRRSAKAQLGCLSTAVSEPVWQLDHAHAITEWAVRLTRPTHQWLPCTFMLGYTGLNCRQSKIQGKVQAMQSSSISASFKAKAFSRSVASRPGLTVGSTRTLILRIASDTPYGRRLTWR